MRVGFGAGGLGLVAVVRLAQLPELFQHQLLLRLLVLQQLAQLRQLRGWVIGFAARAHPLCGEAQAMLGFGAALARQMQLSAAAGQRVPVPQPRTCAGPGSRGS